MPDIRRSLLSCSLMGLTLVALPLGAADFAKDIKPLLATHCTECHADKKAKGGVDLAMFVDEAAVRRDVPTWRKVAEQLASREMPTDKVKVPLKDGDRQVLLTWIDQTLKSAIADAAKVKDPGPAPIRRLTRTQYRNTIRDLLGVEIDAADLVNLPSDSERGYDTYAGTLTIPPLLFEKYHGAATQVIATLRAPGKDATPAQQKAWKTVFFVDRGDTPATQKAASRSILTRFARRAYRRPAAPDELARLFKLFDTVAATRPFEDAIKLALTGALVSPNFLLRVELDRGTRGAKDGYPLTPHELATRLSYLLWSTMPDDELSELADKGTLGQPSVLTAQVKRMLADPRARSLSEGFFATWLQINHLDRARPTEQQFPAFTPKLRQAMYDETMRFVDELRINDGNLLDLLKSDYTFVNEDLAKHYGITGVSGSDLRKVTLTPEHHRGGVLGMGAMLAMTSHTFRTSPTLRGKWVLEVILGTPPPPPPADVKPIDEAAGHSKAAKSFREQLEQHVTDPTCASCHKKMDPLGFAMDSYDAVGAWRSGTADRPLDTSGSLPSGEKLSGVADLREVLWKERPRFVRNLVEQFLLYALGRDRITADEALIDDLVTKLGTDNHRFSTLITGVVTSTPFTLRKNADLAEGKKK
jgi:cytochrome c553